MKPTFDYPTAFSSWGPEERQAIDRVIASGRFTMAQETEQFEHELAAYHGRQYAIAVNSGSSANEVAAEALNYGSYLNRDIAVPALAWATTYSPFAHQGKNFLVYDCDDTWNAPISKDSALALGGAVVCSILGNPAYLEEWRTACDDAGIPLIEDNAESLGARTADGRLTGTFGHLSTSSFFYSHQVGAIELGAILTDDPELARLCRLLRNHGNSGWGQDDFDHLYSFELFGYNVRPVEMHCAIARAQLQKLNDLVAARRANDAHFRAETSNLVTHPRLTSPHSSPFGLAFQAPTPELRSRLVTNLRAAGIDCRPPTGGSFTRHPYGAPWRDQPTPMADLIHSTGLFLGNPPWPAPDLVERAVKVLRETL